MFDILYQDEHLVAIDKPAGSLVHRSDINRHETRIVVQALRDQLGGRQVSPVHRLDKGTSGILLFAYEPDVSRRLAAQFESAAMCKTYWAIVRGWPPECGTIDHPLVRDHDEYGRHIPTREAQSALTHYRRLASADMPWSVDGRHPTSRYAWVELEPVTGRRHQLRRHMKHIAHPIIGDATHGKGIHNRYFASQLDCQRLLLACVELHLQHPVTGADLALRAPPGDQFSLVLRRLGWHDPGWSKQERS